MAIFTLEKCHLGALTIWFPIVSGDHLLHASVPFPSSVHDYSSGVEDAGLKPDHAFGMMHTVLQNCFSSLLCPVISHAAEVFPLPCSHFFVTVLFSLRIPMGGKT